MFDPLTEPCDLCGRTVQAHYIQVTGRPTRRSHGSAECDLSVTPLEWTRLEGVDRVWVRCRLCQAPNRMRGFPDTICPGHRPVSPNLTAEHVAAARQAITKYTRVGAGAA